MSKSIVTISYMLAEGKQINIDVSTDVKEVLDRSDTQMRSQKRQDRRHHANVESTDDLFALIADPTKKDAVELLASMETSAEIHAAIATLSELHRRRLMLYYKYNLSYRKIAQMEHVSFQAVYCSIQNALKRIKATFTK